MTSASPRVPVPGAKPSVIQGLLWPDPNLADESTLYLRLHGGATGDWSSRRLRFVVGAGASFDTSANLLNLRKWRALCGPTDLLLALHGAGQFDLEIIQSLPDSADQTLFHGQVVLTEGQVVRIDLSNRLPSEAGILWFRMTSLAGGFLTGAAWETTAAPKRHPQLALSITTFKRERAVQASVARFEEFAAQSDLADRFHLFVVDNGNSADIRPSAHVTPISNRNLGGSGGFARGLLAAEAGGFSHCLFMDDDASIQMEALERCWALLAYAGSDRIAIAGAMTMANYRWAIWENGALYDRVCRPQWMGTDLRDFDSVVAMEIGSSGPKPANFYGGWWFFAFPIAQVTHHPFPFFVRGDDISFSIANNFEIVTLSGVVCFPDEDFSEKESLQTLYLDLRSHMAHHLALPQLDTGLLKLLSIPARFYVRAMMQHHHDTMSALNLSLKDVLKGPAFFAEHADMSIRRADLAKLRRIEDWHDLNGPAPVSRRWFDPRKSRLWRMVMKFSFNGYLLPFFGLWGNRITLQAGQRGQLHEAWGAAQITYVNADGTKAFTVRHSKLRALREGLEMTRSMLRLAMSYGRRKSEWRKGYDAMTTRGFWAQTLAFEEDSSPRGVNSPSAPS